MKHRLFAQILVAVVFGVPVLPAAAETAPMLAVFPTGAGLGHSLGALITGGDGNLWFIDAGCPTCGPVALPPAIGRITPDGIVTRFSQGLAAGSVMQALTLGPDGNLWFTVTAPEPAIGRITPDGVINEFTKDLPATGFPAGIVGGPDGNLWFTDEGQSGISPAPAAVGRITPSGIITEFTQNLTTNMVPQAIVRGPDGNLWFIDNFGNGAIGRITQAGVVTEFDQGVLGFADSVTAGPDGNVWFTDYDNAIGRITPDGIISEFPGSMPVGGHPSYITVGPDGDLWFPNGSFLTAPAYIGRLALPGTGTSDVALVASVLPASRSVAFGTTANVFATVINTSTDTAATQCSIEPVTNLPAIFSFQPTDPQSNALTGTPNAPITIPPGAAQNFVLAFDPYAILTVVDGNFDFQNLPPTIVDFNFACANAPASAAIVTGVNTLLLSASAQPAPPDIVALAATPGNKGIVTISDGVGAFAVATVNLGSPGKVTVSANLGDPALPVALSICQTVPASGVCMAAPAGSVSTSIDANATPTFAIFLQSSGAVPFLPATNRVFVQFADAGNAIRGMTSVAVQTQ